MIEEPDNLVLKMLREMRAILDDLTQRFDRKSLRLEELKNSIEISREGLVAKMATLATENAEAK